MELGILTVVAMIRADIYHCRRRTRVCFGRFGLT